MRWATLAGYRWESRSSVGGQPRTRRRGPTEPKSQICARRVGEGNVVRREPVELEVNEPRVVRAQGQNGSAHACAPGAAIGESIELVDEVG